MKFREIRNNDDVIVALKLEFKVKFIVGHQNSPMRSLAWGSIVWWCYKYNFLFSIPSLNLIKFH